MDRENSAMNQKIRIRIGNSHASIIDNAERGSRCNTYRLTESSRARLLRLPGLRIQREWIRDVQSGLYWLERKAS